ncbi:MAG: mannose-1-phosphate guanylyltransferase/mannose-6-phosphate isomerase [Pseudomonadales bacterium]|nr:mannose-1-phosphate guanylyltransferase/mannose-6-phosphate isomerase [Pseudomonadales bacterium]
MKPVILSGGSGTRLWPLSRKQYPKQFLPLVNESTMLQDTVLRLEGLVDCDPGMVICNEDHRFLVAEQLNRSGQSRFDIVLEPVGRNTAPAVAVAANHYIADDPVLLVLAADHVIADTAEFQRRICHGFELAKQGYLVTFGIVPTYPETGYGYIRGGERLDAQAAVVDQFVEKPDAISAQSYLDAGNYYWNAGLFMFKASRYLEELEKFNPGIASSSQQSLAAATIDLDFIRLDQQLFSSCPADSIDYAVMENTKKAVVLPLDAGWNDVGSWSSLWSLSKKDAAGNCFVGDVLQQRSRNNYVRCDKRLITLLGVDDLVVVDTADALLVAHKDKVQDVKSIVSELNTSQRPEANNHRKVYRPWGAYDCIDQSVGFQVKRITVNPGASLSLQKHFHRSEHWIVVKGTAEITRGEDTFILSRNESTYIALGEKHRLVNPGKIPLELIEVQSGEYLGEDDIVRIDDLYGRLA